MERLSSKRHQLHDLDTDNVSDHSEFEAKPPDVSTPRTMSDQPDKEIDRMGHDDDDLVGTEEKMVTSPDDDHQVKDEESGRQVDHDQVINEEEKEDIKEEVQAPITLDSFSQEIDHFLSSFSVPVMPDKKEASSVQEEGIEEGKGKEEEEEGEVELLREEEKDLIEKEEEPSETIEEAKEKEEESDLQEKEKKEVNEEEKKEEKAEKKKKKEVKVVSVEIPAYVEKFLRLFEEEVTKRDSDEGKVKWGLSIEEDTSFLQALDRVSKMAVTVDGLRSDPILGELVNWVINVQQRAMSYLEEEFRSLLLEIHSGPDSNLDPKPKQQEEQTHHQEEQEVAEETAKPEEVENDLLLGYTDDNVSNMSKIALAMISGGYEPECSQVYTVIRRHMFDLSLTDTGFEKASIDEIQKMQWDTLERDIPYWNKAFRDCATSFFSKEKKLAETVFADQPVISSSIFNNLTRVVVIQLLNFAEAVAMTKRSSEKLFKFLDMYETLRDTVPEMDVLFPDGDLKTEAFYARCRIGEAAICSFCDLENSIKSDTSKTPVPGGAVHPLTRYTMNYLKYSCEYKSTLEGVFKDHAKIERADSTSRPHYGNNNNNNNNNSQNHRINNNNNNNEQHGDNNSPFANQLIRVMELLDSNLEAKSKLYKDVSLSSIFMMNNGRYILQKIKGAVEIHDAMGDTWCRKKSSHLRNYHNTYKRETLSKLLGCLSHEGLQVNNKVVKPVLKERFKGFNAIFDEIHRTQSSWVICDEQMQSELRVSISAVLVPAYRSFLGRFSPCFTPGRQYEKYIKYQPEEIEDLIDELFDGNRASMARRR